ncbi:MAG TPA: FAD-dependent oxidoreductase [Gordonia sp. (in: high G+C Gram-positive bacteria)]|uniref:FAD-dependent oxidoreductase n=1 Tax=unclassified Gordonia (in: high G+C Gram-positive bacteria) TaxID=2657482 RepID=UPI000F9DCF12|nr:MULTISPECIES: FAD-dependent oxidoreductase [unclassified Gordonia (in: high G+C Gram-positive bacteria)]RUP41347.1 MAG: protoporphyrinogen oxidase [Gordonia sp. (in: high G+C Gram-positive bacteria)]HNP58129.1 FAD-dependent oxidoreductase [Gordonia sp. (in: high G+C Gram-positive bacteria)]HRC50464.1 FAD-dependent oxidoreductase [Gordonia sp. (in: high G+C Gram-positive bacteria)]
MTRVGIIGAGVSGLVAAHALRRGLGPGAGIEVFDSADRAGGLLHDATVADRRTDVGAEAFVLRRPEARDLVAELGLSADLVVPTGARPAVWAGDRLHPLPAPAWMGIPALPQAVHGLADDADITRMTVEPTRPLVWTPGGDCSLGELVADRFGPSVVARSVDPMIGGVYAALAADTGVRAATPALAALLDEGAPSLTAAIAALLPAPGAPTTPVFGALRGGYRQLIDALVESAGARLHLSAEVSRLDPAGRGWEVDGEPFDAVVVAVPAPVAARLLGVAAPDSAEALAGIATSSSAVVALAVDPATPMPEYSGVLAATGGELARQACANPAKALTLSSRKWPHYDGDASPIRLRVSFGRLDEPVVATDEELRAAAAVAMGQVCGTGVSVTVVDSVVARWPQGLPCYAPGHESRIATVFAGLPPGLAVAGSAYRGVGVPACIASARAAAATVEGHLAAL